MFGCDSVATETATWNGVANNDTLEIVIAGESLDFLSTFLTLEQEADTIKIRGSSLSGEAFGLDLKNVDGVGTYYIAPFSGRSARGRYADSDGVVYLVRESSSQVVNVTRFDDHRIAGSMAASAFSTTNANVYLNVYFSFEY